MSTALHEVLIGGAVVLLNGDVIVHRTYVFHSFQCSVNIRTYSSLGRMNSTMRYPTSLRFRNGASASHDSHDSHINIFPTYERFLTNGCITPTGDATPAQLSRRSLVGPDVAEMRIGTVEDRFKRDSNVTYGILILGSIEFY